MTEGTHQISIRDLLKKVHNGSYVIPFFQRSFQWTPGMVCDLLESIKDNYYSGVLLFWNLDDAKQGEQWESVWGAPEAQDSPDLAILDGQQRLSSLYYSIYNPEEHFPNRKSYYLFWVDLKQILIGDNLEGAFDYTFYTKNYQSWEKIRSSRDEWLEDGEIPLPILSASDPNDPGKPYIESTEFENWCEDFLEKNHNLFPDISGLHLANNLKEVLNYHFNCITLGKERGLSDICNIFARINKKGMTLSTFDLMNAFLYPQGVKLRKELWEQNVNEELKDLDSNMNDFLLKEISLIKQNYCSPKYIFNLVPGETTEKKDDSGEKYEVVLVDSSNEFEELWDQAVKHANEARKIITNTGENDFGAIKEDFIPFTTMFPVIGSILWEFDGDLDSAEFRSKLKGWYWNAVFSEDYSGSSDSTMGKDFRRWKEWIYDGSSSPLQRIHEEDILDDLELVNLSRGKGQYKAIVCILALNNCKDFFKDRIVGTGTYSTERINDHHIFPSKISGLDPSSSVTFDECKDSIVNRTLLLDETNQKIKNQKPSDYIEEMISKFSGGEDKVRDIMRTHLINEEAYEHLKDDNFDKFIEARAEVMRDHIKSVLREDVSD